MFNSTDEKLKCEVIDIIKALKKMNKFTDTSIFKIKCNVCYQSFKGQDDAVEHSKKTKHINFIQI